ncbi:MAG: Asparaginyl-tRNA synthetase, partial [Bacteroidota bacterium]
MITTRVAELLKTEGKGQATEVRGWVRTRRGNKQVAFIAVNDGSIIHNIQVVADMEKFSEESIKKVTTGACIAVKGKLVASQGQGQSVEIQADEIHVLGEADETFPLQKKGHSMEFLREIAHLRPRTNTFGAVFRIRHHMAFAVHKYFNDRGFYYLHTPIITGSDAEGAGEMFQVTTLDLHNLPKNPDGSINHKEDFFGKATNLTVSGQLEGELGAMALGLIYTFGPTFRAENSNTPRHLAEFWMIEPEMAFYDIKDNMDLAEDFLKYLVRYALDTCKDDLEFLNSMYDKGLIARLQSVVDHPFERLTYTKAIEILESCGQKFEFPVSWGTDLQKEHENYLVEHFKRPVI